MNDGKEEKFKRGEYKKKRKKKKKKKTKNVRRKRVILESVDRE